MSLRVWLLASTLPVAKAWRESLYTGNQLEIYINVMLLEKALFINQVPEKPARPWTSDRYRLIGAAGRFLEPPHPASTATIAAASNK